METSGSESEGGGKKREKKEKKEKKDKKDKKDKKKKKGSNEEEEEEKAVEAIVEAVEEKEEVEEIKEPEPDPEVQIILRPVDSGWIMGSDWTLIMKLDASLLDLKKRIVKQKKHISMHRLYLREESSNEIIPEHKLNLTFRRLATSDGKVYLCEPTVPGGWLWNSQLWYEKKVIADIRACLADEPTHRLTVKQLGKMVIFPPFIKYSMQVFVRKFPDELHCHVDTEHSQYWITEANQKDVSVLHLPTYSSYPASIAHIIHHTPDPLFDWEAHADINDTKRVELTFEIPDIEYDIGVISAHNIMRADVFGSSDPLVVVSFDNGKVFEEVGRTGPRRNTLNPEWRDARFTVAINASFEVENTRILIEMWDCDIGPFGRDILGDFLGAVELTGMDVVDLIADGKTHILEYDLQQREESAPDQDQSGICGTIRLKGGKAGFETRLVNCRGLVEFRNRTSRVFGTILWNGDEILETMPESEQRDPLFNTTVNIPFNAMSLKLEDCTLEYQVWATVGKGEGVSPKDEDNRGDFVGSLLLTGAELVEFLTGRAPYATNSRRLLKQSKNVPIKMRKFPVEGYISVVGGPSGLVMEPGKKVEIILRQVNRISKVYKCYAYVEWNYIRVYESEPERVELGVARFNKSLVLEADGGATHCQDSSLRIDLFEDISEALGSVEQNYLGLIELTGEALGELLDGKYAKIINFDFGVDKAKDPRIQRLVRGNFEIRGGLIGARMESERVLNIYAAKNLGRANAGATLGLGSSDPFVEIKYNDVIVFKSPIVEANLNPVWSDVWAYIPIPEQREFNEKELKQWIKENEMRKERGEKPLVQTAYYEHVLEIGVYDAKDDGSKGTCLGVIRWEEDDIFDFFEKKKAYDIWVPLGKDQRKENKNGSTRNPTLGTDSQLHIGTPALQYTSPVVWKLEVEAAIEAENARLRAEEEERIALELAALEAERQKEEDAARREEAKLAKEKESKEKSDLEAKEAMEKAEKDKAAAADEAIKQAAEQKRLEEAAKKAADEEAYQEMMELALDDDDD